MKLSAFSRSLVAAIAWLSLGLSLARAQTSLPPAQVNVAYSYTVTTTPAAAPGTSYSATGLPEGLSINAFSGEIAGTPTTAGTASGSVSLSADGATNSFTYTLVVNPALGTPAITSGTSISATAGGAISSYTVTASNTPTSFNVGALPAGLSLNSAVATAPVVSGTPTAPGTYTVALSANNGTGTGATTNLTITVAPAGAVPAITSATTASAALNAAFSYTITASNDAVSYSAAPLPVGLSLNATTGVISGTPTAGGVYSVSLSATNNFGTGATTALTLTLGSLSVITSAASTSGAVGTAFSFNVTASNSPGGYTITDLPPGLTATAAGVISGTPTTAGVFSITASATNVVGTGPVSTLVLTVGNLPTITSLLAVAGTAGSPFTYTITANNGPITAFSAASLPGGLSVNAASGLISGTPTSAGVFTASLTATNAFGTGVASNLVLTIAAAPVSGGGGGGIIATAPVITTSPVSLTNFKLGDSATFQVFATGTGTVTYQWRKNGIAIAGATSTAYSIVLPSLADEGSYDVVVTNSAGSTTSATATLKLEAPPSLPVITTQPANQFAPLGASAAFSVTATGNPALTYQWRRNGTVIAGATNATLALTGVSATDFTSYTVVITNSLGTVTSSPASLAPGVIAAPVLTTQPVAQSGSIGGSVTFTAVATGTGLSYQWSRNGVALAGATSATLTLANVQGSDAGVYTVTITNASGAVTSTAAALTVPASRLANVSVRSGAGTGDQTLIVGLAVGGSGSKQILIRAIGPGLTQFGVAGALVDPSLRLFSAAGLQTNLNEDWGGGAALSTAFSAVGAFALPVASKDAALLVPLATGAYTAQVTASTGTGIALLEAYDSDAASSTARLVNLSARTQVGTGDNILVIGFVVTGTGSKNVLIRAVGPGLSQFGVGGTLADPQLRLFNAAGAQTHVNDDWAGAAALSTAFAQTGAFVLPAASKDAALLVTLPPGAYTAQVSGVNNTTGVALVEVYEAP